MAAAITIAEKREMEEPGVFQYIINEMCKANNIPEVRFPESVIRRRDPQKEKESEKRPRTSDEGGASLASNPREGKQDEYVYLLDTGTWRHESSVTPTPTPTPMHTPTPTQIHSPTATPSHTPAPTPQATPRTTPTTFPQRQTGAITKN